MSLNLPPVPPRTTPRIASLTTVVLVLALLLATTVPSPALAGKCPKMNKQCPANVPFCNKYGYCSTTLADGMPQEGCNAGGSYPGVCADRNGCKNFKVDFDSPSQCPPRSSFGGNPDAQPFYDQFANAEVKDSNVVLHMKYNNQLKSGMISKIASARYFKYGNFSARIRIPNPGKGFAYSFIWKTSVDRDDVGDEIDFEWIPYKNRHEVQTNWFAGGLIDYTKGISWVFPDNATTTDYHVYTIVYEPERIVWVVDDIPIRTVKKTGNNGTDFPSSEGMLFASIWDSCLSAPGTQAWAGGPSEWCGENATSQAKGQDFTMLVDWVQVQCMNGYVDTADTRVVKRPLSSGPSGSSSGGSSIGIDPSINLNAAARASAHWAWAAGVAGLAAVAGLAL
ncbi:hypothetical protein AMAG_18874 [Allomyces macrogynus ATCC 38327]|uniref:GH16 domain-containing protein n=1 Tax=Allomyces macrogynus (strain ATCC 38327) TaxID=578462 RepID=A0A0L0SJ37_ALLM3|nr:hypothetical protein AMAG_18874 [Allomyces macrogynus ATCC 38327]|eukprot:KNE62506.1 hypothetical protein AMAG_18874 [Allomyces macrogynus ATCC 38327]